MIQTGVNVVLKMELAKKRSSILRRAFGQRNARMLSNENAKLLQQQFVKDQTCLFCSSRRSYFAETLFYLAFFVVVVVVHVVYGYKNDYKSTYFKSNPHLPHERLIGLSPFTPSISVSPTSATSKPCHLSTNCVKTRRQPFPRVPNHTKYASVALNQLMN